MAPFILYEAQQPHSLSIKKFLSDAEMFNWTTARQFRLWFTGKEARDNGRIERLLQKLSDERRIREVDFFGRKVYKVRRLKDADISPDHIWHGLGITEGVIRLWKADTEPKTYIFEHQFTYQKPEFGITYSTVKTLLYEFCTHDNMRKLKTKIRRHEEILKPSQIILFVCDFDREGLKKCVQKFQPQGSFYFTDYETFKSIPLGEQLTAQIYLTPSGETEGLRDVQCKPQINL